MVRRGQSKRLTLRKQHKILRKIREHRRKFRLEAKKNPRMNPAKNFHIPNAWPFKSQILDEMESNKGKKSKMVPRLSDVDPTVRPKVSSLFPSGSVNSDEFVFREFVSVVNYSDVIVEVVDARDPIATRLREIEDKIVSTFPDKKIILLLNKVNLVPRESVESWLSILREEFPTVAYFSLARPRTSQNSYCYANSRGTSDLITAIAQYIVEGRVPNVAVIGANRTDCSAVIRDILDNVNVVVESTNAINDRVESKLLSSGFSLLNIPGCVLIHSEYSTSGVLMDCLDYSPLQDLRKMDPLYLFHAAVKILDICRVSTLVKVYRLAPLDDTVDYKQFFDVLARKKSKLKTGGKPDFNALYKELVRDWCSGKILHHVQPPPLPPLFRKQSEFENIWIQQNTSVLSHIPYHALPIAVDPFPIPPLHPLYQNWVRFVDSQ